MNKSIKLFEFIMVGVLFLIIYLILSNFIQEEKIYPDEDESFYYSISQSYVPSECFQIDPNYLVFDNKRGMFKVHTAFQKKCNFTYSMAFITVRNMVDYVIEFNDENLKINQSKYDIDTVLIIVNSSDMELNIRYPVSIYFSLNKSFYNRFTLYAYGSSIENLEMIYNRGLLGYVWDSDGFYISSEGKSEEESNVWMGSSKSIPFNNTNRIYISSTPLSKKWLFAQKVLDAIFLGIIAVIMYEIFFDSYFSVKKYFCKLIRKIKWTEKLKKLF